MMQATIRLARYLGNRLLGIMHLNRRRSGDSSLQILSFDAGQLARRMQLADIMKSRSAFITRLHTDAYQTANLAPSKVFEPGHDLH